MVEARLSHGASPSGESAARGERQGHLALVVVQVCFGLFPVFGKLAFEPGAFTPRSVGAWRMGFAALCLGGMAFLLHGRSAWPRPGDLLQLALCSLLGVTLNMVLYLEGLARTSATHATLLMCLIPVFTFVIAAVAGQERFQAARAVGVLVALCGAALLVLHGGSGSLRGERVGTLLMVANTLSYATYLVVSRPLTRRYPPLVVIAWVFLLSVPCIPFFTRDATLWPGGASTRAWLSIAFILVFPTVVAYLLNSFALSRLRASTTAVYVYVQPLITGVAGMLLLDERPTATTFASGACIFLGIFLVARRTGTVAPAPARASASPERSSG